MDFFYLMLIFIGIAGVSLIFASVFFIKEDVEEAEQGTALLDYANLKSKIQDIDSSISEADNAINELNNVSGSVLKEIENKYQELLFLYNLIDDKSKSLATDSASADSASTEGTSAKKAKSTKSSDTMPTPKSKTAFNPFALAKSKIDIHVSDKTVKTYKNPKLEDILRLRDEGLDVDEIAKTLGLGKGEVSLIMALNQNSKGG